jgi:hypothetical protein
MIYLAKKEETMTTYAVLEQSGKPFDTGLGADDVEATVVLLAKTLAGSPDGALVRRLKMPGGLTGEWTVSLSWYERTARNEYRAEDGLMRSFNTPVDGTWEGDIIVVAEEG